MTANPQIETRSTIKYVIIFLSGIGVIIAGAIILDIFRAIPVPPTGCCPYSQEYLNWQTAARNMEAAFGIMQSIGLGVILVGALLGGLRDRSLPDRVREGLLAVFGTVIIAFLVMSLLKGVLI